MKTIVQKPILHINSENLPSEIIADILGDAEIEHLEIYDGNTNQLNDPIKIDVLRSLLNQLEEKGANYVAIEYHTDHQELELDGILITTATPEEILLHEQQDREYQIKFTKERITQYSSQLSLFEKKLKELTGE